MKCLWRAIAGVVWVMCVLTAHLMIFREIVLSWPDYIGWAFVLESGSIYAGIAWFTPAAMQFIDMLSDVDRRKKLFRELGLTVVFALFFFSLEFIMILYTYF